MALQRKIDKATYDKLSDEMKALYTKKGDDYNLDVEGGEDDAGELRRANDRLKQDLKEAKKALKEKEDAEDDADTQDAKKRGDIEKLEKSWREKNEAITKEFTEKLAKKDEYIKKTLLDGAAKSLAGEISTSPNVLLPHIKNRLTVEMGGDEPVVKVLDADGKTTSKNMDDLKKEFVANKDFSSIIIASKASGGAGKTNEKQGGGTVTRDSNDKPKLLSQMTPHEIAEHRKAAKEEAAQ